MYRRRSSVTSPVTVWFCDQQIDAAPGDSVAAALLSAGISTFGRTPVRGAPRAPFCMIGNCYDCLVQIDGEANLQACITVVRPGMRIRPHTGSRPDDSMGKE